MVTQEALVRNTFQGVTICFVMAYLVLVLSTMNFLTGAIATVTIAGVVVTVMGVGVRGFMGWDLGIGESIAAVILIGLSVDYCVHLANAYTEAPKLFAKTRGEKTRRASDDYGRKHHGFSDDHCHFRVHVVVVRVEIFLKVCVFNHHDDYEQLFMVDFVLTGGIDLFWTGRR